MEKLNLNNILNKENIEKTIKEFLIEFENSKKNLTIKRAIYIYGAPGSGKTKFINNRLNSMNYDIIYYCASDIRNKCIIDTITQYNLSTVNVLSLLQKKKKKKS